MTADVPLSNASSASLRPSSATHVQMKFPPIKAHAAKQNAVVRAQAGWRLMMRATGRRELCVSRAGSTRRTSPPACLRRCPGSQARWGAGRTRTRLCFVFRNQKWVAPIDDKGGPFRNMEKGPLKLAHDHGRVRRCKHLLTGRSESVDQASDTMRLQSDFKFVDQRDVLSALQFHLHRGRDQFFRTCAFVAKRHHIFMEGQRSRRHGLALHINARCKRAEKHTRFLRLNPHRVRDGLTLLDAWVGRNVALAHVARQLR
jgi:hypothetical protein